MALSRGMILICMTTLLVCSFLNRVTTAKEISYGAIHEDNHIPGCGPEFHNNCKTPPPTNEYNRGCEKSHECHGGGKPME